MTRRREVAAFFLAFGVSFILFIGPQVAPFLASRQGATGMFPTKASQQNLFMAQTYVNQVPLGVQVPMSLELNLLYANYTARSLGLLQVGVNSQSVSAGSNVSFGITVPATINQTMFSQSALHVFLIDPNGLIAATWPSGDTLYQPEFPFSVLQFKAQSGSYYQNAAYSALGQGSFRLTYEIHDAASSTGVWKVLAFFVAPGRGGPETNPIPTAVGSGTFEVPQVGGLPSPLQYVSQSIPFFTTWLFLFGLLRKPLPSSVVAGVKTYWPYAAALVLILFYLYVQFVLL